MSKGRSDRLRILAAALLFGLGLLWVRSAHLTILKHDSLRKKADRQQKRIASVPSLRGEIRDRQGRAVALSVSGNSLAVDPTRLREPIEFATAISRMGILDSPTFLERLSESKGSEFVWVTRKAVSEELVCALEALFPLALIKQPEPKRLYPYGSSSASVLGATGIDGVGLVGFESRFESILHGTDGKMIDFRSGSAEKHSGPGRVILAPPQVGATVTLTIDALYQQILDTHLRRAVDQQQARGGAAILLDPRTGEILALSSMPSFDPSALELADSLALRNSVVGWNYEPGSTYKIVTFAAALDTGVISVDEEIDCHDGIRKVAGGAVRDHEPCGVIPAWQVLTESSNIGTGIIAERVGEEQFYRMERLLGFGVPTKVEIPGEERGLVPEPSSWSKRSLVTQAFGQEISCTVLQLAMAYATIANGGILLRPQLVQEIREDDGRMLCRSEREVIRRAMKEETAFTLRELLRRVVTDGTGTHAEVIDLRPAGKTGTAQKYIAEEKGYSQKRYIASFVGFAPYDSPRWLCAVVLDEPMGSIWGGSVAAPVFAEILSDVEQVSVKVHARPSRMIDATARFSGPEMRIPPLEGIPAGLGRTMLKQIGLVPRFAGRGEMIRASSPSAGSHCRRGDVVTLVLENRGASHGSSPLLSDFTGLPLRDATLRARWDHLTTRVEGSGWVTSQDPPAGTPLEEVVLLTLRLSAGPISARTEGEGTPK